MEVSKEIIDDFKSKRTSLGDNPAFPDASSMAEAFNDFNGVLMDIGRRWEVSDGDDLGKLMDECMEEERNSRGALEQLCRKVVTDVFDIPDDMVSLECSITDEVDASFIRENPEKIVDFRFDDIDDMEAVSMEIYRRRMLSALMNGASVYCANNVPKYVKEIDKINPKLREMYSRIMFTNLARLYCCDDGENKIAGMICGKVCVMISDVGQKVVIRSEGMIFPILVCETIKGILELAGSAGLPEDSERADYIVRKSEFKNAEAWDIRIGYPVWVNILNAIDECGYKVDDVGMNFLIMELSRMKVESFNKLMKNVILGTKLGTSMIKRICSEIVSRKERDDFDNFMKVRSERYQLDDTFETEKELVENK